jgi:hypothetical protein
VENQSPSAGEHSFREIQVRIYPWPSGGQVIVSARQRRGAALLVDRRLGMFGLAGAGSEAVAGGAGVLRAAARALSAAADRLDDLP